MRLELPYIAHLIKSLRSRRKRAILMGSEKSDVDRSPLVTFDEYFDVSSELEISRIDIVNRSVSIRISPLRQYFINAG